MREHHPTGREAQLLREVDKALDTAEHHVMEFRRLGRRLPLVLIDQALTFPRDLIQMFRK